MRRDAIAETVWMMKCRLFVNRNTHQPRYHPAGRSWRCARFRWLNQLLLLSAFPVRIFHLDTDLSCYFVLLHSQEWISPTTFIYFHPSMSLLLFSFVLVVVSMIQRFYLSCEVTSE